VTSRGIRNTYFGLRTKGWCEYKSNHNERGSDEGAPSSFRSKRLAKHLGLPVSTEPVCLEMEFLSSKASVFEHCDSKWRYEYLVGAPLVDASESRNGDKDGSAPRNPDAY
jgi:hypothetical protein